jgi:hypothetical protein
VRENDLEVGEVGGHVVEAHRVRVLEPQPAAAREARANAAVSRVEERRQPGLGDHLVQRIGSAVVREELLEVGMELEAPDAVVVDQAARSLDRVAPARVDARERDQHVGVRRGAVGDLLVRDRRDAAPGFPVDREHDCGYPPLTIVGGDIVHGRQLSGAPEVSRRRRA